MITPGGRCVRPGWRRRGRFAGAGYDTPKTPYQRLLDHPAVDAVTKIALGANYRALNPAQTRRDIARLQKRPLDLNTAKIIKAQKEVQAHRASGHSR